MATSVLMSPHRESVLKPRTAWKKGGPLATSNGCLTRAWPVYRRSTAPPRRSPSISALASATSWPLPAAFRKGLGGAMIDFRSLMTRWSWRAMCSRDRCSTNGCYDNRDRICRQPIPATPERPVLSGPQQPCSPPPTPNALAPPTQQTVVDRGLSKMPLTFGTAATRLIARPTTIDRTGSNHAEPRRSVKTPAGRIQ